MSENNAQNSTQEDSYEKSADAPMVAMTPLNAARSLPTERKLSKEEFEQKSWAFLDITTEIVERLGLHKYLLPIGKVMAKAGMVYIHVINRIHILRSLEEQERNTAKEQTKQQK